MSHLQISSLALVLSVAVVLPNANAGPPPPIEPCTGNEDILEIFIEADCGRPVDNVNGGCGSNPVVFMPIECGQTVCGSSFYDGFDRDTDWFLITPDLAVETPIIWSGTANFDHQAVILNDPNADCLFEFCAFANAAAGETATASCLLPPGRNYVWVGPQFTTPFDCGEGRYAYWLECLGGCVGDIDGDNHTGQSDLGILLAAYGTCEGDLDYNPAANLVTGPAQGCGTLEGIDQADLGVVLGDFGCGG